MPGTHLEAVMVKANGQERVLRANTSAALDKLVQDFKSYNKGSKIKTIRKVANRT